MHSAPIREQEEVAWSVVERVHSAGLDAFLLIDLFS